MSPRWNQILSDIYVYLASITIKVPLLVFIAPFFSPIINQDQTHQQKSTLTFHLWSVFVYIALSCHNKSNNNWLTNQILNKTTDVWISGGPKSQPVISAGWFREQTQAWTHYQTKII